MWMTRPAAGLAHVDDQGELGVIVGLRCLRWRKLRHLRASGVDHLELSERLLELPVDRPLIVYCASGYRSAIATSLLRREGLDQVVNLVGGLAAWESARLPTVGADSCSS
jgi:rhodanese-related sulfurtransferase